MECWDWGAIGAVATAVGALGSAFAAGVALWVGVFKPHREDAASKRLKVRVAFEMLKSDLTHCQDFAATILTSDEYILGILKQDGRSLFLDILECPALMYCTQDPEAHSEEIAVQMAKVRSALSNIVYGVKLGKSSPSAPSSLSILRDALTKLLKEIDVLMKMLPNGFAT
jgi:hypothetical protein